MGFVVRVYTFVFHLTLSAFLVSLVVIAAQSHQLTALDVLPFDYEHILRNTLTLGCLGLGCTLLTLTRGFKALFFFWTMVVAYLMVKWFYFGDHLSYEIQQTAYGQSKRWLTIGAVAALMGAGWTLRTRKRLAIF